MVGYELMMFMVSMAKLVLMTEFVLMVELVMTVHLHIEITQDVEAREPEVRPPKRIRRPCVKICVVRRRRIISDHWRTFVIIVVADFRRIGISGRSGFLRCLSGPACRYIQLILHKHGIEGL